jgi:hypothetical protein
LLETIEGSGVAADWKVDWKVRAPFIVFVPALLESAVAKRKRSDFQLSFVG